MNRRNVFNDRRAAVEFCSMPVLLLTGVFAVETTASFADTIDARTSCSVAIQAFDSEKRAGQVLAGAPSPHVQEVGDYIMSVMEQLDGQYMKDGKSGIWGYFSTRQACHRGERCSQLSASSRPDDPRCYRGGVSQCPRVHLQLGIVK